MGFENEDLAISTFSNYARELLSEVRKEKHTSLRDKLCNRLGLSSDQLVYLLLHQWWDNYEQYLKVTQYSNATIEKMDRLEKALDEIKSSPEYDNYKVQQKLNRCGVNSPAKKASMWEVAKYLKSGKTGKETAELLQVSEATVTRRKQEIEEHGGIDKVLAEKG